MTARPQHFQRLRRPRRPHRPHDRVLDQLDKLDKSALIEQNVALVPIVLAPLFRASAALSDADKDDVRGAGYLGLCRAAEAFHPGRGAAFTTFAQTCIRNAALDALKRGGEYRARSAGVWVDSLDAATRRGGVLGTRGEGDEGDMSLAGFVADETAEAAFAAVLSQADRQVFWTWALRVVSEKQGRALWLHVSVGLTLREVGERLGMTHQGVRYLVQSATEKLCRAAPSKPE